MKNIRLKREYANKLTIGRVAMERRRARARPSGKGMVKLFLRTLFAIIAQHNNAAANRRMPWSSGCAGRLRHPPAASHESCLDPVLYLGSCVVLWAFRSALTFLISRVLPKKLSAASMSAL
jgi:hypothetical protein